MSTLEFIQFLQALKNEGVMLTGSFARGDYDQDGFSDIDFIIKPGKMKNIIRKALLELFSDCLYDSLNQ